jgi:hypothetical protein
MKDKKDFAKELYYALSLIKATGANIHKLNQIRTLLYACIDETDNENPCDKCKKCCVDEYFQRVKPYLASKK